MIPFRGTFHRLNGEGRTPVGEDSGPLKLSAAGGRFTPTDVGIALPSLDHGPTRTSISPADS